MDINNPYAQAGWYNPQNPHSINQWPWRPHSSSPTFSALPSFLERPTSVHKFTFTSFNPDITNCVALGPNQQNYFSVQTNGSITTVSKANHQTPAAVIQWGQHPTVEAANFLVPQRTSEFLKLSQDQTHRTMMADGKTYGWIPREDGIYLYNAGPHPPVEFARMRLSNDMTKVYLELTGDAFPAGLLKPSILATILLFSGRVLD
ncbi:hypothetical protein GALMADRAFT_148873 [Galerina marginata CBS 339.88]|uniref:DUF6593 domain-containing protein n=1 Tax=Galerina marginata (strain CBS 339.88) TaxID=685588 RepID=A0A067S312_GALM3|nr:hypothetical protein GALMADRAFT_148873 [Galerina marginata CBS 339.88]